MVKRPTIKDVARRAGVSKSTVSLVLRNSPLVKGETRDKVNRSIKDLNYVYNRSAATLRGSGSGLVGLVINDLRNPFFTEFAISTQMTFLRHGYATVIANTDEDPDLQESVVASMLEHGVSALLISPSYGGKPKVFDAIARTGIPAMQVLRQVDERTDLFPFFYMDYEAGGRLAPQHLLDQGARRIAFIGGLAERPVTLERMAGYEQVMAENDLPTCAFHGRPTRAFGHDMAHSLVGDASEIDAALCFNDLTALGMLSAFAQMQVAVGNRMLVVGFDDIAEAREAYPSLSSVCCDLDGFGQQAATMILDWFDTGTRPQSVRRAPVKLVARQSSGAA